MTAENQAPEGGPALTDAQIIAAWDAWPKTAITSRAGAVEFVRAALAAQPPAALAYQQANPLGGPAKVFRAMADAIEAGDSYEDTLRRYRFAEAQPAPAEGDERAAAQLELAAAWNVLPDTLRCHPGIKRVYEAARTFLVAQPQPKGTDDLLACEIAPRSLQYPLRDYHRAGLDGPLHAQWQDKPHRLLYDLIAAVRYYATAQAPAPAPSVPPGFTEAHASYVARWGGNCRDCADEAGVCPNSGLPCGSAGKAIGHVFKALEYGVKHGYISNPLAAAPAQAPAVGAEPERDRLRAAQTAAVMPLIGPLLDAWEQADREVMADEPELVRWLKAINRAMETAGETEL